MTEETKKLSLQEIVKIISDARERAEANEEDFDLYDFFTEGAGWFDEETKELLKDFTNVEYGCVAGDGSEAYAVLKYEPTEQYIGIEGWYSSGNGYDWEDDIKFMQPYTVEYWKSK